MAATRKFASTSILNEGAPQEFDRTLWLVATKLRNHLDVAEYKHIVLSLVLLKYLSDYSDDDEKTLSPNRNGIGLPPDNLIRLPIEAHWENLRGWSKHPGIGKAVDDAFRALESANPSLTGLLGKNYDRPGLDYRRIGGLIDLLGNLAFNVQESHSADLLGRTYEYFLSQFAAAEGRRGGQYYTPPCVGRLLVEMLAPLNGLIYDPCCGSGGMFVQIKNYLQTNHGHLGDINVYGQESNSTSWRIAKLNLAVHAIQGDLGPENADTFRRDLHREIRADYVFANPPFNDGDWAGDLELKNDPRWKYGIPPAANANFAWVQHFISHLAPDGFAGFVLTNGSLSNNQSGEGTIRRNLIEADLVDCVIAMPDKLFYSTDIPVCLWFLARNKRAIGFRDRHCEILLIDASKLGVLIDRAHRHISNEEIQSIARTYHAWRGLNKAEEAVDVHGFSRRVTLDEIAANEYLLTPSLYVGIETNNQDRESLAQVMPQLLSTLKTQFTEGARLQRLIEMKLRDIGYGK